MEHVINLLIGHNDSFSHTTCQFMNMLIYLIPLINRLFSLVAQEGKQKAMSNEVQQSMKFLVISNQQKARISIQRKDFSCCSHCKIPRTYNQKVAWLSMWLQIKKQIKSNQVVIVTTYNNINNPLEIANIEQHVLQVISSSILTNYVSLSNHMTCES